LTVEIVLLAMVALFVGLRLYAVLGQRTGQEQQPVTRPEPGLKPEATVPVTDAPIVVEPASVTFDKGSAAALRALIAADPEAQPDASLAAQLERLAALHERGHLSAEEFAAAKRRVLGS